MFDRDPMTGLWRPRRRGLCSIMPGLGMLPPGFGPKGGPVVPVTDMGTLYDTGTDSTGTFGSFSFGAEASDRLLIALHTAKDDASSFDSTSTSIGGVDNDQDGARDNSGQFFAQASYAAVPTGASGSVLVSYDEAIAHDQACVLLRAVGFSTSHKQMQAGTASSTSVSRAMTDVGIAAGDLMAVVVCKGVPAQAVTFSDNSGDAASWVEVEDVALADNNSRIAAAYKIFESAHGGGCTVTATGGGTSTTYVIACVQFAAA